MNDRIQNWLRTTWQIRTALHMPELDFEAVQFALFESDPVEGYRKILTGRKDRFRRDLKDEKDPKQRELTRNAQISATWDGLFKSISGDQVHLLVSSRNKTYQSSVTTALISSDAPDGRRWLATKIAYRKETPTCWCIPLDTVIGKSMHVELRKENAFDPLKVYHELIEKS